MAQTCTERGFGLEGNASSVEHGRGLGKAFASRPLLEGGEVLCEALLDRAVVACAGTLAWRTREWPAAAGGDDDASVPARRGGDASAPC